MIERVRDRSVLRCWALHGGACQEKDRNLLMVLQAYFDSSGQIAEKNHQHMMLAGIFGTEDAWSDFTKKWISVLGFHDAPVGKHGERYFHFHEALHGVKGYSRDRFDQRTARYIASQLMLCLNSLRLYPYSNASTCTANLSDHRRVKQDIPNLRSPEDLCLDHCVHLLIRFDIPHEGIALLFDRGESFQGMILREWNKEKNPVWWKSRVSSVTSGDIHRTVPLQMADLLASVANRYYRNGPNDYWGRLYSQAPAFPMNLLNVYYDERKLREVLDVNGDYREGASLGGIPIQYPTTSWDRNPKTL